jgi:wyosine [tRNA(Phe)-imidazoG37] synthetase (radical SAM superfamily)
VDFFPKVQKTCHRPLIFSIFACYFITGVDGMSILFKDIVFGPVRSRRFGVSLGINLLPFGFKYCNFNCLYCECGWTGVKSESKLKLFSRDAIRTALDERCSELRRQGLHPENLTFAGNGEPTIHPDFPGIVDDTITIRERYFPTARVTILSNASLIHKPAIRQAMEKVDNNVLKLDCGTEAMFRFMNRPLGTITLDKITAQLKSFSGNVIIQSLFVRGEYNGTVVDNTVEPEIMAWLQRIGDIRPAMVMVYTIDRQPPVNTLLKVPLPELESIAAKVEALGIPTKVYG